MTAFAGVVSLSADTVVPAAWVEQLATALTRQPGDRLTRLYGLGYALVKLDLGIFMQPGELVEADGAVSLLSGDPLLEVAGRTLDRNQALAQLAQAWRADNVAALQAAHGSFCLVHYHPTHKYLWLATDRLGMRPLYVALHDDWVVFATALRVLEAFSMLPKRAELRGVAEIAAFGFALGTRTAYTGIHSLAAGQLLEVRAGVPRWRTYWNYNDVAQCNRSEDDWAKDIHAAFRRSVRRRLGAQRAVVAYLSGGLDSRAVVSCLRSEQVQVHSIGVGWRGSADLELGRLAAQHLGTRHFEYQQHCLDLLEDLYDSHAAWLQQSPWRAVPPRPNAVWSGDGGELILGPVRFLPEVVRLLRGGALEQAIDLLHRNDGLGLPKRLFTPAQRDAVVALYRRGIHEELAQIKHADAARQYYLFMILNEERRQRAQHYEQLDLRRQELITPFCDPDFIQLIASAPIDQFLRHRFYHRWLREFSPETTASAWQTYPGHEACPVPRPAALRDQWQDVADAQGRKRLRQQQAERMRAVLRAPSLPTWLIQKYILRVANWCTRIGLHDYFYLFRVAEVFCRYPLTPPSADQPIAAPGALKLESRHVL